MVIAVATLHPLICRKFSS